MTTSSFSSLRRTLFVSLLLAACSVGASPAFAQSTTPKPSGSLNDPAAIERFFDSALAAQLEDTSIAGGVVSVVKDGKVVFQKGYGFADAKQRLPVDPTSTMFRIGSITKLFTATAVMQLVEQGKLDLDADVNDYLDFTVPTTFDEPITLANLLTHTSGFENRFIGMWPSTSDRVEPLGAWLATNIPARVRPPGVVAAYSNYGAALAGYIVERASGTDFARYVDQNIFVPLGMVDSSAEQPVNAAFRSQLSNGYRGEKGQLIERDFEWLNMAPAGVITSSASDVAQFMIAHLQLGRLGDSTILREDSARLMQQQHFANAPGGNGVAYGFYETSRDGLRAIGHGGDTELFHSVLTLLPEHNVGVFVSFNSAAAGESAETVRTAFIDNFFPATTVAKERVELTRTQLEEVTGKYRLTNTSYASVEKVLGLFGAYTISAEDGKLVVDAPAADEMFPGARTRFLPVKPAGPGLLAFSEENGATTLVFRTDATFGSTFAFVNSKPVFSLERLTSRQDPQKHQLALAVTLVTLLSGLIVVAISALRRHRRRRENRNESRPEVLMSWIMGTMGVLALVIPIGMIAVILRAASLAAGNTFLLASVLTLIVVLALCSALAVPLTALAWMNSSWSVARRVHATVFTAAALVLIGVLNSWNLVGWRY